MQAMPKRAVITVAIILLRVRAIKLKYMCSYIKKCRIVKIFREFIVKITETIYEI